LSCNAYAGSDLARRSGHGDSADPATDRPWHHAGDPRQYEIGSRSHPAYQGRGYSTEAVCLLIGYLFTVGQAPGQCALRCAERRPGCPRWPGWGCAGKGTRARAPGQRASGPTTCCTGAGPRVAV